jgi:hypothetical protein
MITIKTSRVFSIIFVVLTILLLSACSKKSTPPPPSLPQWTILGYFDGNNDQDKKIVSGKTFSYVIKDVQEMEKVGSTQDVQIVVMLGSFKTKGNCNYYFIEKCLGDCDSTDSISSKVLDSLGIKDMSNPQTLRDFIKYGVEHYPAQHYVLIINDHGDGWRGVCSDSINGDQSLMTLPELSFALSGYKFDIIVFDAPSMSMVEVAYQLKDKANYLVLSQYRDFRRNILCFGMWLQDLTISPNMSVRSLAREITQTTYTTAVDQGIAVNISAIGLSQVDALISKIADFGSLLGVTLTGDYWKEVVDARKILSHLPIYFFDLKNFCQNIQTSDSLDSAIKNAAQAVENANDVVVVKTLSSDSGYGGLSIHFPYISGDFDSARYVELDFAVSNWHIFLSRFIQAYAEVHTGSLQILTYPVEGARIFLDGQDTGLETNTTIHGIPEGDHTIKVVKTGYKEEVRSSVYIIAGSTKVLIIHLYPLSSLRESISELQ